MQVYVTFLGPLNGPLDVGGQCPEKTFNLTTAIERDDTCCCDNEYKCCWDKCNISFAYPDCLPNVSKSRWIYEQDPQHINSLHPELARDRKNLGYFKAFQNYGKD